MCVCLAMCCVDVGFAFSLNAVGELALKGQEAFKSRLSYVLCMYFALWSGFVLLGLSFSSHNRCYLSNSKAKLYMFTDSEVVCV